MGEDRLKLLDYYRALYATKTGSGAFTLDAEARARWAAYGFPGNVRELKNIVTLNSKLPTKMFFI
jgi:two-component system nitrogen regulation response regulator GlnG